MLSKLLSSQVIIYHIFLFIFFSLSVNYFVELEYINFIAYSLFHLTLIYFAFYFFNFILIFIYFLYGIFFDIFLINYISPHLLTFLIFISLFYFSKRYLLNLSSIKISIIIIFICLLMLLSENIIAYLFFNFPINIENLTKLMLITIFSFYPLIIVFDRIDNL